MIRLPEQQGNAGDASAWMSGVRLFRVKEENIRSSARSRFDTDFLQRAQSFDRVILFFCRSAFFESLKQFFGGAGGVAGLSATAAEFRKFGADGFDLRGISSHAANWEAIISPVARSCNSSGKSSFCMIRLVRLTHLTLISRRPTNAENGATR